MADSDVQSWEYLERLQGTEFYRLYKNPSSALAIFRKRLSSLGKSMSGFCSVCPVVDLGLAKSLVMALLYLNAPMPVKDLDVWVKPGSRRLAS
jgi:transcription initiation factor TFIIH subunit 4